ncbi:MAG: hypothetical protein PHR73_02615 [Candidatus Omnitrophica bacterium]|nr:hypothetical protein [Candidatus Omnitrophota bacterium]
MRRADRLFGAILILLAGFASLLFAEGSNEGVISRPVIEYTSGDLRDPFSDLFQLAAEKEKKEKEEQKIQAPLENIEPEKPLPSLDKFKVQGLIWGGKFPQAIINNKVLGVGDSIEGVEIVNIDKKGITLDFAGRKAVLANPGSTSILEKVNKEEK